MADPGFAKAGNGGGQWRAREPITGVWGWGPGAEPLVGVGEGQKSLEAERVCPFSYKRRPNDGKS